MDGGVKEWQAIWTAMVNRIAGAARTQGSGRFRIGPPQVTEECKGAQSMATLTVEKRPQMCDGLLGKRVYLQFLGASTSTSSTSTDAGSKMGGVVAAIDDKAIVLQEGDRIYFIPWTSIRWVHPIVTSETEREELTGWMDR
jgi:hypothetical protein